MKNIQLWKSKTWLYRRYVIQKKTEQEIADEAGTNQVMIHRYLKKFEII